MDTGLELGIMFRISEVLTNHNNERVPVFVYVCIKLRQQTRCGLTHGLLSHRFITEELAHHQ